MAPKINTHDVTPGHMYYAFELGLRSAMHETVHSYERFTPLEMAFQRALGIRNPPAYFHELLEFRR